MYDYNAYPGKIGCVGKVLPHSQIIVVDDKRNIIQSSIETKRSKKEADMDKDCDEAISQIISGKYAEGLYGYTQIFCYGISFFQKQAKVKKIAQLK